MFIVVAFLLLLVIDAMICSLMVYSFAMISNYFPRGKRWFYQIGTWLSMQKLWRLDKRMCWCYWQCPSSHSQLSYFSWLQHQSQCNFSGHYRIYGIYFQAVCDCDSWFIYIGVIAPGRCSDQVAFEWTVIFNQVAALNKSFHRVSNAAYTFSDVLQMVPFVGSQHEHCLWVRKSVRPHCGGSWLFFFNWCCLGSVL